MKRRSEQTKREDAAARRYTPAKRKSTILQLEWDRSINENRYPSATAQLISPATPHMFRSAPITAVCLPEASIVAAQLAGMAIPERKDPSETIRTATIGFTAHTAARVLRLHSANAAAAVPARLMRLLP